MMPLGNREVDPADVLGTPEHAARIGEGRHPAVRDALQWLTFAHLPTNLQNYVRPIYQTAVELVTITKDSADLTHALMGMIGAKDWAVRAGIRSEQGRAGSVPRPQTVVAPPMFQELGR